MPRGLAPTLRTCPHLPTVRCRDLSRPEGPAGFLDRIRAYSSWHREAPRSWTPWPIRPFVATWAWTLMVHAPEEFLALVRLLDRIEAEGPGGHPTWELRHRFFRALTRPVGPRGLNAVRITDWGRVLGMGPDVAEGLEAEILAFLAVRWSCEAIAYAPGATMIDRARHLVGDWLEGPFPVRSSR